MTKFPSKSLAKVPEFIEAGRMDLAMVTQRLAVLGKTLGTAHNEQCEWPWHYEQGKNHVHAWVKYVEMQFARVKADKFLYITDNSNREMSEKTRMTLAESEKDVIEVRKLLIELEELYQNYVSTCEMFNRRGFALRDKTTALVNEIHNVIL